MLDPIKELNFDIFSDEVRINPYPYYEALRTKRPIYWCEYNNAWIITRYNDALLLLNDPKVLHWGIKHPSPHHNNYFSQVLSKWFFAMDPRNRSSLRLYVAPLFTPNFLIPICEPLHKLAETILDDAELNGGIDVINDYAGPIVTTALRGLIGIPDDCADEFHRLVRGMIGQLFITVESSHISTDNIQAMELITFLRHLIDSNYNTKNNLIASLRKAQNDSCDISNDELIAFLALFLFAGYENMMNFLGNATCSLVAFPDQLTLLRQNAEITPTAVEELLRFDSPIQFMTVEMREEITLSGKTITRNQPILISIGSANRDSEHFADADILNLTRTHNDHLCFGRGPLTCIGARLARLESQIAIRSLARRMRRPSIQDPIRLRRDPNVLRGFDCLFLSFDG